MNAAPKFAPLLYIGWMAGEETLDSSWGYPNRPTHADFSALSSACLAMDAASHEGDANEYAYKATGHHFRELARIADHEYPAIRDTMRNQLSAMSGNSGSSEARFLESIAAWSVGFNAGLTNARGKRLASNPPESATIDQQSLVYTARARATIVMQIGQGADIAPKAAWIDGCIVGATFDKHKADIST